MTCQWTPYCDESAVGITRTTMLGKIPVCLNHDLVVEFDPENPHADLLPDPPADWLNSYDNIVLMVQWMAQDGRSAYEVAHAVEKPHKYVDEYKFARRELEDECK